MKLKLQKAVFCQKDHAIAKDNRKFHHITMLKVK